MIIEPLFEKLKSISDRKIDLSELFYYMVALDFQNKCPLLFKIVAEKSNMGKSEESWTK